MTVNSVIKKHMPHSRLSGKLWDNDMKMKKDARKRLLLIADAFVDYIGVNLDVLDVTITGSYANYNYTPYSDIDLHIIVDYDDLSKVEDLSKEFFHAKKSFWNDRHEIKFKGVEVELYAQNNDEPHSSSGVYSIEDDKWLVKPKKFKDEVDIDSVKSKYKKIKLEVDESIKEAKEKESEAPLDRILKKIRKMRKAGLEKSGELSDENLVYKVLRAKGYLQKLFDLKYKLFDDNLTS